MKLLSLFPVFAVSQKIKPTCDTLPQDQITPGANWNCVDRTGESATMPFNQSDKCHVNDAKCSGTKFCHKGEWRGKIKCKKDCYGQPEHPVYGGYWFCQNAYNNLPSCTFTPWDDFTCDTSGVSCNTVSGEWRGRTTCRYSGAKRPEPNPRPNGDYSYRWNGKCSFICDDGSFAGRMFYDRKSGKYTSEKNWYHCCPAPACKNGVPFSSWDDKRVNEERPSCPVNFCESCDSGFHLDMNYNYTTDHYEYTCEPNMCVCENGSAPAHAYCNHNIFCESCDPGYELLQNTCVLSEVKEFCYKADPVDIIFVVDGSGSVEEADFIGELNLLKSVSAAMDLGNNSTRIALIQYGSDIQWTSIFQIEFDYIEDSSEVLSSFANINQIKGGTATGGAISFAYNEIILKSSRPGVQVKIVVVTMRFKMTILFSV